MNDTGSFLFYSLILAFALGIFVRSFYTFGLPEVTWLIFISLVVALIQRRSEASPRSLLLFSLVIFAFALGVLRLEMSSWNITNPVLEDRLNQTVTLTGVVKREPDLRERTTHLYVEVEDSLVLVMTDRHSGDYFYGDKVEAKGKLEKPEAFETDLGREFNYPGYLLARGTSYTMSFAEVVVLEREQGSKFLNFIYEWKYKFMTRIESLLPEPQAGLSEGLLLGVKRALGEDLEETFRRTGIIHIVVLSGYNVMIVVTFVMYVLGYLFGRKLSSVFGISAIVLFAILVGLSATVVRASIMASLLLLVGLTGRVYLVLRGLMLAGLIMLIFNPFLLVFDTGFQLSFMATLGLIVAAGPVAERLQLVPTWFGAREFLTATLVTQLFVLPLLLYQIGEFSVVAVIVNVLVLPMVPVAMLLTFITGMLGLILPALALPLSYFTHLSLSYIVVVAEWFGSLPFASFVVPAFPFVLVPVSYGVIGYLVWHFWYREKEDDELAEWTIVEELEFIKQIDSDDKPESKSVPHFFR